MLDHQDPLVNLVLQATEDPLDLTVVKVTRVPLVPLVSVVHRVA